MLSSGKAIISKMLVSYPMCSKARGGQEVIIDYLLCQCAKAKCAYRKYNSFFEPIIMAKITYPA